MDVGEITSFINNKIRVTREERDRFYLDGNLEMVEKSDIELKKLNEILERLKS